MSVRKPTNPFRADVLRGERGKYEGDWVPSGASPDPIDGSTRPAVVGSCPVCNLPVLEDQEPTEVQPIIQHNHEGGPFMCAIDFCPGNFQSAVARGRIFIHGSFDCMDQPQCDETRRGELAGTGEWSVRCMLPANHPDDCYWSEP